MKLRERTGAVEGAGADRHSRARSQSRPHLSFHQAGTGRYRHGCPRGRQGKGSRGRGHPAASRFKELQPSCAGPRRAGDPLQRARHAAHQPPQGGERVRQHVEHRGFSRGGNHDGRNGMGHAREVGPSIRLPALHGPAQPDLPCPHGDEHVGALLGALRDPSWAW